MPGFTINESNIRKYISTVTTRLSLSSCEALKKHHEAKTPFSIAAYQGGNPDYRVIEIPFFNREEENQVRDILVKGFSGGIISTELIFKD